MRCIGDRPNHCSRNSPAAVRKLHSTSRPSASACATPRWRPSASIRRARLPSNSDRIGAASGTSSRSITNSTQSKSRDRGVVTERPILKTSCAIPSERPRTIGRGSTNVPSGAVVVVTALPYAPRLAARICTPPIGWPPRSLTFPRSPSWLSLPLACASRTRSSKAIGNRSSEHLNHRQPYPSPRPRGKQRDLRQRPMLCRRDLDWPAVCADEHANVGCHPSIRRDRSEVRSRLHAQHDAASTTRRRRDLRRGRRRGEDEGLDAEARQRHRPYRPSPQPRASDVSALSTGTIVSQPRMLAAAGLATESVSSVGGAKASKTPSTPMWSDSNTRA